MPPSRPRIGIAAPKQIACLACASIRIVYGIRHDETGECPACGYLGWTYSEDLDGTTRRAIANGRLAAPPEHRPRPLR